MSRKSYNTKPGITNFKGVAGLGDYAPMEDAVTAEIGHRCFHLNNIREWRSIDRTGALCMQQWFASV